MSAALASHPKISFSMRLLLALLLGYALLGRGFAHLGVPPLYVGEMVLGITGFALLFYLRGWSSLLHLAALFLLLFVLWCMLRTLPYLSLYGADALRDGVLWGYALFALFTALYFAARPALFPRCFRCSRVLRRYSFSLRWRSCCCVRYSVILCRASMRTVWRSFRSNPAMCWCIWRHSPRR